MAIIKTKKFILRPPRLSDAVSLTRHINDKKIARNTSTIPHPYTLADAKKWLKKNLKKQDEVLNFIIEIEKEAAGSIGLMRIKHGHKAELGYWLSRKHWGRGIMTEAVEAVTRHGFEKFKLKRIQAHVFTFNKGSMRVLEKNGYKLEGLLKKVAKRGEKIMDAFLFAKIMK